MYISRIHTLNAGLNNALVLSSACTERVRRSSYIIIFCRLIHSRQLW